MSRKLHRLNVKQVEAYRRQRGLWADGGNLFLRSTGSGRYSWLFIYKSPVTGRQRAKGLGSAAPGHVSLDEARAHALACRKVLGQKRDPIEEERAEVAKREAEAQKERVPTFGQVADAYLKTHRNDWSNPKRAFQWKHALTVHAKRLRPIPVDRITRQHVLDVLDPLWTKFPETAQRLRARIQVVLEAATHDGWVQGVNVAAWAGLKGRLAKPPKLVRGHHPSLPHADLPAFMAMLRGDNTMAARLLEIIILTASRQGEMRALRWSEIDFERRIIVIPASRMKIRREHRIPLSDSAFDLIRQLREARTDEKCGLVFVSGGRKPFSDAATARVLRRLGFAHITTHGFRSSFRDWSAERTETPFECAELCLAHHVASVVARAYLRTDLMERRRRHMQGWALHCDGVFDAIDQTMTGLSAVVPKASNVLPFKSTAA